MLVGSSVRSATVGSSPSVSPVSAKTPRPRPPLSIRSPPSDNSLLRKREADRFGRQRLKGDGFMKSRVKHVSQNIIRSKWTVLDGDAQAKVEELLRSTELPVLASYSSEQRKIVAQIALRSINGTLCKCLPRMPFPPKTKEIHFDYDTLVKDNRDLQQSLATSVKSNLSLVNEVEKQKLALSSERHELEGLGSADRRVVG
ncbi:hypothetical protein HO173_004086 [Letharia columbiana]|uniref:Uncharacterized protein n=1 Tax=Letharia columbiana TaxID=112416 RepID=A0A8H6FZU2_9LECA|nr:uncharacterized protein HO173_004086 [Letharia columbiana]KAF6237885.1 hypothetical protein HO173_004086 [Letharia columbiana]